ncbi:MAG: S41 family peptidase, partial [Blautia sp.]|nr:S41 family peptidase [Blautia sp.]
QAGSAQSKAAPAAEVKEPVQVAAAAEPVKEPVQTPAPKPKTTTAGSGAAAKPAASATAPTTTPASGKENVGQMILEKGSAVGKAFTKDGAVGHAFTKEGAVGKAGSAVGHAFTKEGAVGKAGSAVGHAFTKEGAVGKAGSAVGHAFTKDGAVGKAGSAVGHAFTKDGAVGKAGSAVGHAFTKEGAVGKAGSAVGHAFTKEGAVGKAFTKEGAIGKTFGKDGTVSKSLSTAKKKFDDSDSIIKDKTFLKGAGAGIGLAAVCVIAWTIGAALGKGAGPKTILSDPAREQKFGYLQELITKSYLEDVDESKLTEGVYAGLVSGLGDPYSKYLTAEEYAATDSSTSGTYVGLGVQMMKNADGYAEVTAVYEGSAAQGAGMLAGDEIRAIDGADVVPMTTAEIVSAIQNGKEQTVLTVYRPDTDETLELTATLSEVEIPTVSWELLDGQTGLIRITGFAGVTKGQYDAAMEALRADGMQNLVIDLRDNNGGLLTSACDILREILPEGTIVYTEDKDGNRKEETCDGQQALDMPLAVLVNGSSASAAEIFAGAVKDLGAGTVIGTTTYGKGVVQSIHQLSDGSAVKLTEAKYYTPNGNDINGVGITPDVEVGTDLIYYPGSVLDKELDGQLAQALETVRS